MPEPRSITEIAEQAADCIPGRAGKAVHRLRNQSRNDLDARAAVVRLLRDHADILEEYE